MTSRDIEEGQKTQVSIGPNESQLANFGLKKPPSSSNKTLIFAILVLLILAITFKVISLQIKTQKEHQSLAEESSINPSAKIEATFANLTEIRRHRQGLIQRIKNSQTTFECIKILPVPHYFRDINIYFASDYGIFVQGCIMLQNYPWSITRQNLRRWNNDRAVTEWALQRLLVNEKVLYYRPEVYNIPEVTLLRSLIGQTGEIVILEGGFIKECLNITLKLHGLNSSTRYESLPSLEDVSRFSTIIADVSLFTKNKTLLEQVHPYAKIFVVAKNSLDLKSLGQQVKSQQFRLPQEDCGKGYFTEELSESGFYEIHRNSNKVVANPIMSFLKGQYSQRKSAQIKKIQKKIQSLAQMQQKCLKLDSQRRYQQVYLSIYGRGLLNVNESEVRKWQSRRQAVEWMRTKIKERKSSSNTYYEMSNHFNLVAILEIALLANDSTLYVVCTPTQCERIKQQKDFNSINNIQLLVQKSLTLALASDFLITDSEVLTEQYVSKGYSSNGQILAYFSHTRNESMEALRRLYVHHHIRQVTMRQSLDECLGFEYLHYFWNSDEPEGFYQLKPSTYVLYSFWGEPPNKLKERKRLLIQQLANLDVESKILGPKDFTYFQVPERPIHPAFSLLSFIHKSDYFRMYMMHSYGGGYCDVKHMHFAWRPYLQGLEKDADHWAYGYGEAFRQDVACFNDSQPSCDEIQSQFRRIIGNGLYAFKRNTPLTTEWYNSVMSTLDKKYEEIKKNPPRTARQFYGGHFLLQDGTDIVSKYPLRWAEIGGEKLARAQHKYLDKVKATMPNVIMLDYRNLFNND